MSVETIEITSTNNCIYCKSPASSSSSVKTVKCQHYNKKMLTEKLVNTVDVQVTANKNIYIIQLRCLDQYQPNWKSMPFSELEDDILINGLIHLQRHQVIRLSGKNEDSHLNKLFTSTS